MPKVEIERGPLVGGVLIAVSAAIAVALNTYSGYQSAPLGEEAAMRVHAADDGSACCDRTACDHDEQLDAACSKEPKRD